MRRVQPSAFEPPKPGLTTTPKHRVGRLITFGVFLANVADAQRIVRPSSLWGRVYERPESFGFGGVELLATLIVLLLVLFLLAVWHCAHAWRLRRRATVRAIERTAVHTAMARRERTLARITYVGAPLLGIAATLIAPARTLVGVDLATWIVCVTAATVALGAAALLLDHGSRRRLQL